LFSSRNESFPVDYVWKDNNHPENFLTLLFFTKSIIGYFIELAEATNRMQMISGKENFKKTNQLT